MIWRFLLVSVGLATSHLLKYYYLHERSDNEVWFGCKRPGFIRVLCVC